MILRIIVLTCALLGVNSLNMFQSFEFKKYFGDICFQNDDAEPFRINGQDNPLSSTLENFISLAEKFEVANPTLSLRDELFYFIRYYIYEDLQLTSSGITEWAPKDTDFVEVKNLWEPDDGYRNRNPHYNEVFSDDEKCSLYFMISHSILDEPKEITFRSATNFSQEGRTKQRSDLNPTDFYPQEVGVVAVRGTDQAVSLSRVLVGLYTGMKKDRKKDLTEFQRIRDTPSEIIQEKLDKVKDKTVDPLYTLTLAEVLMLSAWTMSDRRNFTEDGVWISDPPEISSFCPMVFKPKNARSAYSYSSMRGAIDGLVLGSIVNSIIDKKDTAKLSQILRMYYSREGITLDQGVSDLQLTTPATRISFCNRKEIIEPLNSILESQMELYAFLVSGKFEITRNLAAAKDLYLRTKEYLYRNEEIRQYCNKPLTLETPEDLPKETFLDVIVIVDTSAQESFFKTQQKIVGNFAKQLDLRNTGSRMTIFLDQKVPSSSSSAKLELESVVLDSESSSCAACAFGQIEYSSLSRNTVENDQVIIAVDQFLHDRKENETKFSGSNGKVVVFFNFENGDSQNNNRIQTKIDKALRDLFTRHLDVNMYAVGLDKEMLKKYAKNDGYSVVLSAEGDEFEVAKNLYDKISSTPGIFQYINCNDGRGEGSAVYENFVSPLSVQHWKMPAEYFYKSFGLKVIFETQNRPIRVCHSRATPKPEFEIKSCYDTTTTNRIEFKLSNPCERFTKETCSPFYFSVIGMSPVNGDSRSNRDYCTDNNDQWCNKLDSIKFRVSHDGVRCSGCLGLNAHSAFILVAVLFSFLLSKLF